MGRGGSRPGAGRPRSDPVPALVDISAGDSLEFLRAVMSSPAVDVRLRIMAAVGLAPYEHRRQSVGGKKDAAKIAAEIAARGRFAPGRPPAIVAIKPKE